MSESRQCTSCGAVLQPTSLGDCCAACLLETGLQNEADTATRAPIAARTFGAYELIEEIARGGQGVVYRARHTALRREVALKMIPSRPWVTPAQLHRLRREALTAAELDHPAIVPIYDLGEVDGQPFFAMKLVSGASLGHVLSREALPPQRAAELIAGIARAIHYAHERGVLHRDLKPGNILIDEAGQPHITDFGLAKHHEQNASLTQTQDLLGTPSYMSPEMAAGTKSPTPATDIYSLGAVLYHLLTNHPPFQGDTALETLRRVHDDAPPHPREWNSAIDPDLASICLQCLEKVPAHRYPSAAALADDLERWLRHEPVHARQPAQGYRLRQWTRRHAKRLGTIGASIVAVAAVVAILPLRRPLPDEPPYALAVVLQPADAASRYLATEYSRDLIHSLGKLSGLSVAPRGVVLSWEGHSAAPERIGAELQVPAILYGTVHQQGDGFRLTTALLEVPTGRSRWARTFDEKLANGATVHAQIVRSVAAELGVDLTARDRADLRRPLTPDHQAWRHYLRARQQLDVMSEAALLSAVGEFEQALALDPEFAQAAAGLADAHLTLGYIFRDPAVHYPKARDYVRQALDGDDTLPEAIVVQGTLAFFADWDWDTAEKVLARAVLLDPSVLENHACYLHSLAMLGRPEEALRLVESALTHHPRSMAVQAELACTAYYAGRYEDAANYLEEVLGQYPDNAYLHWSLARTLAQLGRHPAAIRELETARTKPGGDWPAILSELAYVHGSAGERETAAGFVRELEKRAETSYVNPYEFAMAYLGLGDVDAVIHHLRRAVAVRSSWVPNLPIDPKFAPLRGEPAFRELLAELRLPAAVAGEK